MKKSQNVNLIFSLFAFIAILTGCGAGVSQEAVEQGKSTSKTETAVQEKDVQTKDAQEDSKSESKESKQDKKTKTNKSNLPNPLITATELEKLFESKDADLSKVRILEPSTSEKMYAKGHVPQSQYLHWVKDMTDPKKREQYNNLTAEQFQGLMEKMGIENDSRVIIYDRFSSRLSTRLYWTFKFFGHDNVQVLDGGFDAWEAQGLASLEVPVVTKTSYKIGKPRMELLAEMDFVKSRLNDPKTKMVDGRPPKQFSGEEAGKVFHTKKAHPRKGHIPDACNVFWKDNFNADGTFKTVKELRALYKEAGVTDKNSVITYCNEGLHAAPPWFVLTQILDFKDVQLYDSSMVEWTQTDNPMNTKKK